MEKLSAGTGGLVSGGAHMLIDLSSWYKTSLPPKIELIQGAIEQHRTIRFIYFSPKRNRSVLLNRITWVFHWSAWYVWGWCRTREGFRLFKKLNRMTGAPTRRAFCATGRRPCQTWTRKRVFPVKYRATVLVDQAWRWRLVEEYGSDSFTEEHDGTSGASQAVSPTRKVCSAGS